MKCRNKTGKLILNIIVEEEMKIFLFVYFCLFLVCLLLSFGFCLVVLEVLEKD